MKKSKFLIAGAMIGLSVACLATVIVTNNHNKSVETQAYTAEELPSSIDLNDSAESEIRSYYDGLTNLASNKKTGTALLGSLKSIISNGQKYYAYDGGSLWDMYEITDRDWSQSPASKISGYNSSTNKITNYTYNSTDPYVHSLYTNRNVTNQATAHSDHTQTNWGINQEHVWPKSHGFNEEGAGGARGDPMHLMAGNGYANNIHSNYFYGYVDTTQSYKNCGEKYSFTDGNLRGISKTLGSGTVFEPQDSDKGDIARAVFYMVARYNTYGGSDTISTDNPNLELVERSTDGNGSSSYTSSSSTKGQMGIISDLLKWNKLDKPDAYEIHRNNLLFKNFTKNRNPFIDFPEWADYIWGDKAGSSYAAPASDTINDWNSSTVISVTSVSVSPTSKTLTVGDTQQLTATVSPSNATNKEVTYSSSNAIVASVSSNGLITANAQGSATITVTTVDGNKKATCSVTVNASSATVTNVTVSPSTLSLDLNGETTGSLSATVSGTNNPSQSVTWSSNDASIAVVSSSGEVTAMGVGETTIVATSVVDGTKQGSCTVSVTETADSGEGTWIINFEAYKIAKFGSAADSSDSVGGYTSTWTSVYNGFSVSVSNGNNNRNGWAYVKFGRNGNASTGTIVTSSAIDKAICKVGLNISAINGDNSSKITSVKLYVSDSSDFSSADEYSFGVEVGEQSVTISSPKANQYYKIEIVCASASANGIITISDVNFYDGTFIPYGDDPYITSINVSPSILNLDLNGVKTGNLTAEVTGGNGATLGVVWDSSNTSVATVDSNGKVTAIGKGTAVITATSTDDGSKDASCTVNISDSSEADPISTDYTLTSGSPYINGVAYKMYFYSTNYSRNYYFTGSLSGTYSSYGSSSSVIGNATNVYFEADGDGQNLYFYDSDSVKQYLCVVQSGTYYNFGFTTSKPSTKWKYVVSGEDYACMTYYINNANYTFGSYSTYTTFSSVNLSSYTTDYELEFVTADTTGVEAFASVFMNNINCDSTGRSTPTFASGITWSSFSQAYQYLNEDNKTSLQTTSASIGGSAAQQAMHRYDYMIGKYGSDTYNDFIGRNPASLARGGISLFANVDQTSMTAIIILLTMVGVTSIGVIITLKKRKEN